MLRDHGFASVLEGASAWRGLCEVYDTPKMVTPECHLFNWLGAPHFGMVLTSKSARRQYVGFPHAHPRVSPLDV